jgi:hypothetical protein
MGREYVGMRINPKIIEAIDEIAREQNRNRSNTIEWVLFEWLREHRPELVRSLINKAITAERFDEETKEAMELIARMPAEDVADTIEAISNAHGKGRPKKAAPEPSKKAKK